MLNSTHAHNHSILTNLFTFTPSVGISNFNSDQIESLLKTATVTPAVNQCDMGVSHHDDATIAYCQQHNITYEAWGAMKGCPFTDPTILSIAKAHSVSPAQVCLRWGLDRGCVLAVRCGLWLSSTVKDKQYRALL